MDQWFAARPAGRILRGAVVVAAMIVAAATASASAQTLAEPNPPPKSSAVQPKPHPTARAKSCAQYGAGFAPMPGTGACIKIGGFVEGAVGSGR